MKKRTLPTANLDLLQRLYRNGVIWVVLFVIFFTVHSNGSYLFRAVSSLCFVGLVVLLVTITNKVLLEHFMQRGRVVLFILLSIVGIVMWAAASTAIDACLLHWIDGHSFGEMSFSPFILVAFLVRLIWFIATYAITVIFYFQRKENEEKIISDQLKSEKLDMELRYLKSQINPHFLFNALNNIYSMVYTHDDNAADVYLKKDVENEDFMIAPMLLQPIIENCFKYSRLETHPDGYVHVSIKQKGRDFCFEAENTVAKNALPVVGNGGVEKKSGIGQKNVQQRLMLHYGEDYKFDIQKDKEIYKVRIEL